MLAQVDWNFLKQVEGVNNKFESFSGVVQALFNSSFPYKTVRRNSGAKHKPKLSKYLKDFANDNVDLGILARDSNDPILKAHLKARLKVFRKLLLEERRAKISHEVRSSDCVQRAIWNVVRREIRETHHHDSIPSIKTQGMLVQSPSQVVNLFNNHFSDISRVDAPSFPNAQFQRSQVQLSSPVGSLFLSPVTSVELEHAIHSLKSKRSSGIDGISSSLLKKIYKVLLDPLVYLFNTSLSSGVFPDVYKTSKIVPVFKKGDKNDVNNYRPIALLCTLSKVLEKVVYVRLMKHLDRYNILTQNQYGFREKHSTSQAAAHFIKNVIYQLECREPALGMFCDLSRAFDRVDHDILCQKLEKYGVRGVALAWFRSYLSDRGQFVEISGIRSEYVVSEFGVPQGSILGPPLFVVYINDLAVYLSNARPIFYADDTTLLFGGPQNDLQKTVTASVKTLQEWLSMNNLKLNSSKTVFMQFLTLNKRPASISLAEFGLEECSSVKFLGLTIDSGLSWSSHISQLCSKLSRICFALRTLQPLLDFEALLMVYHGCFSSVMSYGVEVWGGSPHVSKVFLLQKRAIRIIKGIPPLHSCRGLFGSLNILTLPSIYIFKVIMSTMNQNQDLPVVSANHKYPTRHGGNLRTPRHRLALSERDVSYAGPMFYNKLPTELKSCRGNRFRSLLKNFLISGEFYSVEEFLVS